MLGNAKDVMTMIPVKDADRALQFYTEVLGFKVVEQLEGRPPKLGTENGNHITVYVPNEPYTPTHTLVTFFVDDAEETAKALRAAGVSLDHVEIPGLGSLTDENGIMRDGGAKLAWFKDSEENTLGIVSM